jgi:hypothetical protein
MQFLAANLLLVLQTHNNVFLWQFCAANVTINSATGAKQFLYRILGGWVFMGSFLSFFLSFYCMGNL